MEEESCQTMCHHVPARQSRVSASRASSGVFRVKWSLTVRGQICQCHEAFEVEAGSGAQVWDSMAEVCCQSLVVTVKKNKLLSVCVCHMVGWSSGSSQCHHHLQHAQTQTSDSGGGGDSPSDC